MTDQPTTLDVAKAKAERDAARDKLNAYVEIFEAECKRGHKPRAAEAASMADLMLQDYLGAIEQQHVLSRKLAGL